MSHLYYLEFCLLSSHYFLNCNLIIGVSNRILRLHTASYFFSSFLLNFELFQTIFFSIIMGASLHFIYICRRKPLRIRSLPYLTSVLWTSVDTEQNRRIYGGPTSEAPYMASYTEMISYVPYTAPYTEL